MPSETATFGAGCFWGVEHLFRKVPGVIDAVSGYSGGFVENPTYRDVCSDTTGHAEVVEVTFDPEVVSFDQLLEVFWAMHDPTQVNRQGPDRGSQYRSIVLTHSDEQQAAAEASRDQAQSRYSPADRHGDPAARRLLSGRGLSPALLPEQRTRAVLPRDPAGAAEDLGLVTA